MDEPITGKQLGLTAVRGWLMLPDEIAPFLRVSPRWIRKCMQNCTFPIRWRYINSKCRAVDSADLNDYLAKVYMDAGTALLPTGALKKILKEKEVPVK